ncbi:MAG TPA: hypothetical protein VI864_00495 [Candidatus Bathyarchaeia archaeon]|nr:hypothetical protein [Candidatus Bathyarchaeia archaeon]
MIEGKMENFLAREIKRRFDQATPRKFDKIFVSKRPFQVPRLRKKWHDIYGRPLSVDQSLIPPLQPEIDMILCEGKTMTAVELKYFRKKGGGLSLPFYAGIEQTLALLRWGFDHAALWQLFEESISAQELWFYGGWTWRFLHAEPHAGGIMLPVEFTFMLVKKEHQEYQFHPIQPMFVNGSVRLDVLRPPYDPKFTINAPHMNPLLQCPEVKVLREMLVGWLETQEA